MTITIGSETYTAKSTMFSPPGYQGAWVYYNSGSSEKIGGSGYSDEWIINDPSATRNRYLFEWWANGIHYVRQDWAIDDNRVVNINEGLKLFENHDAVLSCCESKRFSWRNGKALNYDIFNRPRRQDFRGTLIENGAFYISLVADIKKTKNRISGDIGIYQMPEYTYTEIDEPEDWIVAESLMKKFVLKNEIPDLSKIKIFLSDVDGVLTDAGMYYTESGDEFKKFSTYDGMGFQLLQKTNIKVGLLTSEDRELNRRRAKKLDLNFDFHGAKDKLQIVKDLCAKENISLSEVAYIGDDVNDLEILKRVGFSITPKDGNLEVKKIVDCICKSSGGEGVLREICDLVTSVKFGKKRKLY